MNMLKDLELIDSNMIQTVYAYNKLNEEEMAEITREVVHEHKSGHVDPTSIGRVTKLKGKNKGQ